MMTSKEKILTLGASFGLALGLVLLLFVQLRTDSPLMSPMPTTVVSPISQATADENCNGPCLVKGKKPMTTSEGVLKLGQGNVAKDDSFFPMNNTVAEAITVTNDLTPPVIHQLVISERIPTTSEQAVTLDVSVTDPPPEPISGVSAIRFIEYEYILSTRNWVPIQSSQWVDYAEAQENYPWMLSPTYGIRYMQAWAKDQADNISLDSSIGVINLLPSEQVATLSLGEVDFYRIYVEAGQTLSATLTPVSGDPDLYIWGPSDGVWYTNSPTEVERLTVPAPDTGTYQLEVHGYTEAEYKLNFGTSDVTATVLRGVQSSSKPSPTNPTLPLDSLPDSLRPSNNVTPTPSSQSPPWLEANQISISSVTPKSGWNDVENDVYIEGNGFTDPLTVTLDSTRLTVREVLSDRILAIVPTGLGPESYDITVDSASFEGTVAEAYKVLDAKYQQKVYIPITIR